MRSAAIWLIFMFAACNPRQSKTSSVAEEKTDMVAQPPAHAASGGTASFVSPYAPAQITYEIIDAPGNTFGYKISVDGKVFINQPHIPGVPGLKGFSTKQDAAKVAELVISKIKSNQMPPTVTEKEMRQMQVIR